MTAVLQFHSSLISGGYDHVFGNFILFSTPISPHLLMVSFLSLTMNLILGKSARWATELILEYRLW